MNTERHYVSAKVRATAEAWAAQRARDDEVVVWVRRQWNDLRRASFPLSGLSGVHWSDMSGGVTRRANRRYLHAYVSCDAALEGEVAHSCLHGEGPHRIKVCIVAKDNTPAVMAALKDRVTLVSRW